MPFGFKNVPPTYQRMVNMAFKDYLGMFMKVFLDDFNVFNNLDTHLTKLWLCFDKCREFSISLNLEKCMFLVHLGVILGYVLFKEGNSWIWKRIWLLSICLPQKQLKTFRFSMEWHSTTDFSLRILLLSWLPSPSYYIRKTKAFKWTTKCQEAWEVIKQHYVDALILISPHWDLEVHVHTYVSNLVVGAISAQNILSKNVTNQLPMHLNYSTMPNRIIWQLKGRHLPWCMP
jgi:hypothetical protein